MDVYSKDLNGDPRCPINNQIDIYIMIVMHIFADHMSMSRHHIYCQVHHKYTLQPGTSCIIYSDAVYSIYSHDIFICWSAVDCTP